MLRSHLHCLVLPKPILTDTMGDMVMSPGRLGRRMGREGRGQGNIFHELACKSDMGVQRGLPSPVASTPHSPGRGGEGHLVPHGQAPVCVPGMMSELPGPQDSGTGHGTTVQSRVAENPLSTVPTTEPWAPGSQWVRHAGALHEHLQVAGRVREREREGGMQK